MTFQEWLEAVTVNLVREGVNKHKARELAQHFHSLIQKDDVEPVATLYQHSETGRTRIVMRDDVADACATWFVVGDLYLRPTPKPMTNDQIYELYSEPRSDAEMVEFARAVERHHGIGK